MLLRYLSAERTDREAYFLFRGVSEDHWDAIEAVLERRPEVARLVLGGWISLVVVDPGAADPARPVAIVPLMAFGCRAAVEGMRNAAKAQELASATGATATHTYETPRASPYVVRLTVTDM